METKNKKMEWAKPILEEFAKVRYTLGSCAKGSTPSDGECQNGTHATNACHVGTVAGECHAGATASVKCETGSSGKA
jgi:hypothetical protein